MTLDYNLSHNIHALKVWKNSLSLNTKAAFILLRLNTFSYLWILGMRRLQGAQTPKQKGDFP